MGFLEAGTPLPWSDSLEFVAYATSAVREHGIIQFLHTFHRVKSRQNDSLKWGDEIEYHLIEFHDHERRTTISLTAPELVHTLEEEDKAHSFPIASAWRPEYGSWMVEATPGVPYSGDTSDLRKVELNMAMRRYRILRACPPNVTPFSIVNYPFLGVGNFTSQRASLDPLKQSPFSRSAYVPDACISPHPRFGTLTANIRHRRGRKVCIQLPLFMDYKTSEQAVTTLSDEAMPIVDSAHEMSSCSWQAESTNEAVQFAMEATTRTLESGSWDLDHDVGDACVAHPGSVHMDCMAFGMGCCCLQVTFQARDLPESRFLYDQLAIISPLMMALTANAPIWRGRLADVDTRWDVIAASVDCRTPAESATSTPRPDEPTPSWMNSTAAANAAGHGSRPIPKSRYSSIDGFISNSPKMKDAYNDIPFVYDERAYEMLLSNGVDERLSQHIAHLFVRDPLVIFKERVFVDDAKTSEHFENIQSTNWRSVRWKPPPPDAADMGWRVELRTMEAQLTDFENAAFTVFVVLLSRVLLFFDLDLYMPLSKVDANFERARLREAAGTQKFFFRSNVVPLASKCDSRTGSADSEVEEMTLAEIFLGKRLAHAGSDGGSGSIPSAEFPGIVPLIFAYLDLIKCDEDTRKMIDHYIRFVTGRATGEISTGATWQRRFVMSHPDYAHDSVVSPAIGYDLLRAMNAIAKGVTHSTDLLGASAPAPIVIDARTFELPQESLDDLALGAANSASMGSTSGVPAPHPSGSRVVTHVEAPHVHYSDVLRTDAAPGVRMRGRSFADEIRESSAECLAIRALLDRYIVKEGAQFADIPAFLGADDSDARLVDADSAFADRLAIRLERSV